MADKPISPSPPASSVEEILAPSRWINPRRPLTAMTHRSGGQAGGVVSPACSGPTPKPIRFLHRHPPVATTSEDSYFISGGICPFCDNDEADDEADQLDLWYELAGGVEKESEVKESEVAASEVKESDLPASDSCFVSSVYFPFHPTTDEWAACVAVAEKEVDEVERTGNWK